MVKSRQFQLFRAAQTSLRGFHQLADAARIRLPMTVAGQRVAAPGRFNQNIRPDEAGPDMNGGHLVDADADFVAAEPCPLMPDDRPVRHLDDGGKKEITARPPARFKCF